MSRYPQRAESHSLNRGVMTDDDRSDTEQSFADSPTDGYFSERNHPHETFVPNPAMHLTDESKSNGVQSNNAGHPAVGQFSQMSSPATSLRSRSYSVESLPMLDAGPAPPDYAAATAHRAESQSTTHHDHHSAHVPRPSVDSTTSYGSMDDLHPQAAAHEHESGANWPFGNANNPFGPGFPFGNGNNPFGPGFPFPSSNASPVHANRPYESSVPPQDMSDRMRSPNNSGEETILLRWNRQPQAKKRSWSSRICGQLGSSKESDQADDGDKTKLPGPGGDDDTFQPPKSSPKYPSPPEAPSQSCSFDFYTETVAFTFQDLNDFSFSEKIEQPDSFQGNIGGNIHVRPAKDSQESDIVIYISIATSTPWQVTGLNYLQAEDAVVLKMPHIKQVDNDGASRPCMEVFVWVDVRDGVQLSDFSLSAMHLGITVHEGLFENEAEDQSDHHLQVQNVAALDTVVGDIVAPYWASRRTIIHTVSGNIKGEFALLDHLGLYTSSGDVKVEVDPKDADDDNPAPATFVVNSISGDVKADFPLSGDIPLRLYQTTVETTSGDIRGGYLLGHTAIFSSTSGTIKAKLKPYHGEKIETTLRTSSQSSTIDLSILSPHGKAGIPWRTLVHTGSSTSGTMRTFYPPEWEGKIEAATTSGDISLKGKDLKVIVDKQLPWARHVLAEKGEGIEKVKLESVTGDIKIYVVDEPDQ